MGQIEKTVSFSERGSLTENNGTITHTHAQLLMVMEKFNFLKNFKKLLMKKFSGIEQKIGDLYDLDNFKQKNFFEKKFSKLRKQLSFFDRFLTKVKTRHIYMHNSD